VVLVLARYAACRQAFEQLLRTHYDVREGYDAESTGQGVRLTPGRLAPGFLPANSNAAWRTCAITATGPRWLSASGVAETHQAIC
jgi:hypothetical protein